MGRRSLKTENVEKILNAFEVCIEKHGLKGAAMERIAEQAKMDRRMISHYLGKREDLVNALVKRIVNEFGVTAFERITELNDIDELLDYYFSEEFNYHPKAKLVAALLPEAVINESIRAAVKSIYDSMFLGLDVRILKAAPLVAEEDRQQTAFSIMCLAFGGGWMINIGFPSVNNRNNLKVARKLIDELKQVKPA